MEVAIMTSDLRLDIYGFSGTAMHKDYVETAFRLMDKMWQTVRAHSLKHKGKGLNIWVYEPHDQVFAGVELEEAGNPDTGLECKTIHLAKYARYKHIGPYNLIKQAGQLMSAELKQKGYEIIDPYIEIYGHWTNDESRLETDLLMSLK